MIFRRMCGNSLVFHAIVYLMDITPLRPKELSKVFYAPICYCYNSLWQNGRQFVVVENIMMYIYNFYPLEEQVI